jgi:DNA polymerase III epsilon subunit-like protein
VRKVVFVDTETTGLDPDRHEIWDIGMIVREEVEPGIWQQETHQWFLDVNLTRADSFALSIGRYHERHPHGYLYPHKPGDRAFYVCRGWSFVAYEIARLTFRAHLIGAVVSFDEERLRRAMLAVNVRPEWHYHLCDVENLAAGALALEPPWDSTKLSNAVGVDPNNFDRHTALGDAEWAAAIYDSVMNKGEPR